MTEGARSWPVSAGALLIVVILMFTSDLLSAEDDQGLKSLEERRQDLLDSVGAGGSLTCESKLVEYKSCYDFDALHAQGCYGRTTIAMTRESYYQGLCSDLHQLLDAAEARQHYFELSSYDWWRGIPAAIIQPPGGIYNNEGWDRWIEQIDHRVKGKALSEIDFLDISAGPGAFSGTLQWPDATLDTNDRCSSTVLSIKPIVIADFNGDSIGELQIQADHHDKDVSCSGSGRSLGGSSIIILNRESRNGKITIWNPDSQSINQNH